MKHLNLLLTNRSICHKVVACDYLNLEAGFYSKLKFPLVVVNYFDFFLGLKTAFMPARMNSPFFELKYGSMISLSAFINNLNIAGDYNFKYI